MNRSPVFRSIWLAFVLGFFGFLAACTGPRPEVSAPAILPRESDRGPYGVSLVVRNAGSGEGQVDVNVWLHEKNRHETYFGDSKINLRAHERVSLIVRVDAPPGDYTAEAKTVYPPQ